jgi:two-component system chemotaxis sensor kinase CheA
VAPPLTSLLLRAADQLRELVDATRRGEPGAVDTGAIVADLEGVLGEPAATRAAGAAAAPPPASTVQRVRFVPQAGFFRQGQDVLLVLRELAELGELLEVSCDRSRLPALDALDPATCYLAWTYRLRVPAGEAAIRDVFMFVEDACELVIEAEAAPPAPESVRRAGDETPADAPASADRRVADRRSDASSIRVSTDKVDTLINLVGELVIAQAMVNQSSAAVPNEYRESLLEAVAAMDRSTRELQEKVMSIRMLPIGAVFNRFPRLVHDLAQALDRRVRLETTGADIELDKGVIERLGDPLTHLIRNSVDHGIEPAEERARAGKDPEGVIELRAYHEGGNVVIEVADDGRGLDRERIHEKAVAQGLARPDVPLTDDEVYSLIFQPGFSTAKVVSDVSGRGVGMDVVKRNVQSLNGSIAVSSRPGHGSRIRIRLPLTLAILDGLSVKVGNETFIIPMLSIAQSVRPSPQDVKTVMGGRGELFKRRGEQVPLVRLERLFGIAEAVTDPAQGIVTVLELEGRRFGLLVDDVLGQSQVVIKSLERNFRKVDAIMGATILGDGRVAFILDVSEIRRLATRCPADAEASAEGADAEEIRMAA